MIVLFLYQSKYEIKLVLHLFISNYRRLLAARERGTEACSIIYIHMREMD